MVLLVLAINNAEKNVETAGNNQSSASTIRALFSGFSKKLILTIGYLHLHGHQRLVNRFLFYDSDFTTR